MNKTLIIALLITALTMGGFVTLTVYENREELRGRYDPVVINVEWESYEKAQLEGVNGYSVVWLMDKVRECDYLDLNFIQGERNGVFQRLEWRNVTESEAPPNRPTGKQVVGPIFIFSNELYGEPIKPPFEDKRTSQGAIEQSINWFANVRHTCYDSKGNSYKVTTEMF